MIRTISKCQLITTSQPCKFFFFSLKLCWTINRDCSFDGLGIIHTAKKHIKEELFKKILAEQEFAKNREMTTAEKLEIKKSTETQFKEMNLNQVCLCFQAFIKDEVENVWVTICLPVYSNVINNMKSALTGELRITRMSAFAGPASGGQEVFMFVEKVCKSELSSNPLLKFISITFSS